MDNDKSIDFKLERYKYILQEIHTLNDNIHKYLTLFQTLGTIVIGGGISVFISWKNLNVNSDLAIAGIQGLLILLVLLALFAIISVLAGIFSWYDYRLEEAQLLDETIGVGFRKPPTLRNCWRWYETYMIAFIILIVLIIVLYVELQLIPLIHK